MLWLKGCGNKFVGIVLFAKQTNFSYGLYYEKKYTF